MPVCLSVVVFSYSLCFRLFQISISCAVKQTVIAVDGIAVKIWICFYNIHHCGKIFTALPFAAVFLAAVTVTDAVSAKTYVQL